MKKWQSVLLLLLLGAFGVYCARQIFRSPTFPPEAVHTLPEATNNWQAGPASPAPAQTVAQVPIKAPASSATAAVAVPQPTVSPSSEATPLPAELSNLAPETVLENMRASIRLYGSTFGGNPVGTNLEITKALQGDNPKHINFLKPDGNRVNDKGELIDPWGSPYFFHQLSATEMEIHSAGPDKTMWTGDDLVTK